MKKNVFRLIVLILLISGCTDAFGKITFQLLPRQNVISGTKFQITLRLRIEDENLSQYSMPAAPDLAGCTLLAGPNQTSSQQQFQIINGKQSSSQIIDLTCTYRADKPGNVKISPVSINVGGKSYSTGAGSFDILPPDANSQSGASSGTQGSSSSSVAGQAELNEYFVRVIFSKSSVYEQEGVIATTKLYRPANNQTRINLEAVPRTPVYEGFLSEDLNVNSEGQVENYKGKNYFTYELSRVLLFPQKAGQLKVTSGTYTLSIRVPVNLITMGGFYTRQYETISYTTPLATGTIDVKALPEPRPLDFTGAVGNYSITASLSPETLRTNESATYSLVFKGTGNVKYLTVPDVDFPSTFDKYTAKSDVSASISDQTYTGTFTVNYPIVPQEVGEYDIPAQTFSYFSLSAKKYIQVAVPSIPVTVHKGASVAISSEQKEVDTSMKDILHIHTLPAVPAAASSPVLLGWWYWILWIIALLALIIAVFSYRHHMKLAADVIGRRNARANRVATKRFKIAASLMKSHQDSRFYEELSRALKGYIGDKLGINPSGLISDTISEKLTEYGVDRQATDKVLEVLDECEMARFTPDSSDSAMHELYDKACAAVKSIEDVKVK